MARKKKQAEPKLGHNGGPMMADQKRQLEGYISEIERWEAQKKLIVDDIGQIYASAAEAGFDTKAMRHIVKVRKADRAKQEALENAVEVYKHALGMLADLAAARAGCDRPSRSLMRVTEDQYAEILKRTGVRGEASTALADTAAPPFKLPPNEPGAFALGRLPAGTMNKTEAAYDEHLSLRHTGDILWHKFEAIKLRLADNTFITIDFAVLPAIRRARDARGQGLHAGRREREDQGCGVDLPVPLHRGEGAREEERRRLGTGGFLLNPPKMPIHIGTTSATPGICARQSMARICCCCFTTGQPADSPMTIASCAIDRSHDAAEWKRARPVIEVFPNPMEAPRVDYDLEKAARDFRSGVQRRQSKLGKANEGATANRRPLQRTMNLP
jgi:uncharacterized protein (UPF0335 family)